MDARAGSLWHKRAGVSNSSDLTSISRWTTLVMLPVIIPQFYKQTTGFKGLKSAQQSGLGGGSSVLVIQRFRSCFMLETDRQYVVVVSTSHQPSRKVAPCYNDNSVLQCSVLSPSQTFICIMYRIFPLYTIMLT